MEIRPNDDGYCRTNTILLFHNECLPQISYCSFSSPVGLSSVFSWIFFTIYIDIWECVILCVFFPLPPVLFLFLFLFLFFSFLLLLSFLTYFVTDLAISFSSLATLCSLDVWIIHSCRNEFKTGRV